MDMFAVPRLNPVKTQWDLNIFVDMLSYLTFRLEGMPFHCASFHNFPFIQASITEEGKHYHDKTQERSNYLTKI